jgi:hypothetical protein
MDLFGSKKKKNFSTLGNFLQCSERYRITQTHPQVPPKIVLLPNITPQIIFKMYLGGRSALVKQYFFIVLSTHHNIQKKHPESFPR